ncbi:MAG: hypothetical protein Kow0092_03210 [Deferrisomatales bacterium]
MTVEEALRTALAYEHKVRDHFHRAAEHTRDPRAKWFFQTMAREEQGHVDYLEAKLKEWTARGTLAPGEIATAVPDREWLARGMEQLEPEGEPPADRPVVREYLFEALRMEQEVSAFYRRLVESVGRPDAEALFRRFLEIEDGHTALVQAEIDYETHTGYFFDLREFTLDG